MRRNGLFSFASITNETDDVELPLSHPWRWNKIKTLVILGPEKPYPGGREKFEPCLATNGEGSPVSLCVHIR